MAGATEHLRLEHVCKSFGGVQAVRDLSFTLAAGELVALIGPNGAGKSTVFNVIAGAIAAERGQIQFEGEPLLGDAVARARRGVGRTFQSALAFGSMTLRQNVQLAVAARSGEALSTRHALWRYPRAEVDGLLAQVGLAGRAEQAPTDLAYSDLKRLELALALAGRPRLLLMDEPTAGMAPAERFALMDLVRQLVAAGGLTVLFTEHSMDVVFGYAQRVLLLSRGGLIADGLPAAVRADPAARAAYFDEAA